MIFMYSKTPWDAAPWHTNFADTLFWFRFKNSQDTLFFGQFINPKLHYSIFAKIVIIIFTEMSGEKILILVLSNAYFSTPSNLHTAMKNFPYLILCSGQNTSLLIQVTLST